MGVLSDSLQFRDNYFPNSSISNYNSSFGDYCCGYLLLHKYDVCWESSDCRRMLWEYDIIYKLELFVRI